MFEGLDEKFDMTTEMAVTAPVETPLVPLAVGVDTLDEDVEVARQNIKLALATAQDAIMDLANIAKTAESPRAFEVLGQFVKTISDTSKDLVELQQKKQDARKRAAKVDGPSTGKVVNNNVFVGSTTDLLKMLKNKNREETPDV